MGGNSKYDLHAGTSKVHSEGDDGIVLEPVFVPAVMLSALASGVVWAV